MPPTLATALPYPTGPYCSTSSQDSSSTSPGTTCCLKRQFFTPPKMASLPLFSGRERAATAPVWARASRMSTPGMMGCPGKWPVKKGSFMVTHLMPVAFTPGSHSVILSTSRKGGRWGRISMIC